MYNNLWPGEGSVAEVRYDLIIELGHSCLVRGVPLGRYSHEDETCYTYNI